MRAGGYSMNWLVQEFLDTQIVDLVVKKHPSLEKNMNNLTILD